MKTRFLFYLMAILLLVIGTSNYWLYKSSSEHIESSLDHAAESKLGGLVSLSGYYISHFENQLLTRLGNDVGAQKEVKYLSIKSTDGGVNFRSGDINSSHMRIYSRDILADGKVVGQVMLGLDSTRMEKEMSQAWERVAGLVTSSILTLSCVLYLLFRNQVEAAMEKARREKERVAELTRINQTLEHEVVERKKAEVAVIRLNDELEQKVLARTADLEQARIEANHANSAKSAFLASMSHEIRTPMNAVIGLIDVLQRSDLAHQQMELINIVRDSAYSLLRIIDDILDFSKIEAGKLTIDAIPMCVEDIVEAACESMSHLASSINVELTMFVDPNIPGSLVGDPGRLRQTLVNLINNAIKFSGGDNRLSLVSVRTVLVDSTPLQTTLEFRVADNGIGIDETTQARLFSPFTQADTSTTRKYGGTGLGLAISLRLVSLMGGEITVNSEVGKGSVFTIRMPFDLAPSDAIEAKTPSHVEDLPCVVIGGSDSLADDFASYLTHGGALVERIPDLTTACEQISAHAPGQCVWVIDSADTKLSLSDLCASAHTHRDKGISFVVVERGQRRLARMERTDLVRVDGNALSRKELFRAVAIAADRITGTAPAKEPEDKTVLTVLSRDEAHLRGRLILVAEDNEINQKVIVRQLSLLGYTADIAVNGREALSLWQSSDYDILITDLHMPEMDGYELAAAVRALESATPGAPRKPVIAITANALKGEADHCRAIGMDDYLSKPVQLPHLKATLEKWLDEAKASDNTRPKPAT